MRKTTPLADRMLSKIRRDAGTGCWEWTGVKNVWGYGQISVGLKPHRKMVLAHRASYECHYGEITDDLSVLHRCDNPGCVNPEHLFLGTHSENMADCKAKSRNIHGESHPLSKLTEADVRLIRSATEIGDRQLAEKFGVDQSVVNRIRNRKLWASVS